MFTCPPNSVLTQVNCSTTIEIYNKSNYLHELDDGNIWAETLVIEGKKVFNGSVGGITHNFNYNGAIYNTGRIKKISGGMVSQTWFSLKKTLQTPATIQCSTGLPYKNKCRSTQKPKIIYR